MLLFYSLPDAKSRGNYAITKSDAKILQRAGERCGVFKRKAAGEQRPVDCGETVHGGAGLVPETGGVVVILNPTAPRPQQKARRKQEQRTKQGMMRFFMMTKLLFASVAERRA